MKYYYGLYVIISKDAEKFTEITYVDPYGKFKIKPIYEVSNYGQIYNTETGNMLKSTPDKLGYHRINLLVSYSTSNIKQNDVWVYKSFLVHRLVAWEFCKGYDISKNRIIINHLDSDPSNNYYENLEWCTQAENLAHAIATGRMDLIKLALKNSMANRKYSIAMVESICQLLHAGYSPSEIKDMMDFNNVTIKSIYGIIDRIRKEDQYDSLRKKYNISKTVINKSTSDEIHEICRLLEKGYTVDNIVKLKCSDNVKDYAKMRTKVSKIHLGKHYPEISSQYNFPNIDMTYNKKYTDDVVHNMCKLIACGKDNKYIIDALNLDKSNKLSNKYLNSIRAKCIRKNIVKQYDW